MKNVHFLTHQDIFDRTVPHLFGQGRAALLPRGGGAYRGGGCSGGHGNAHGYGGCPVGSFIRSRDYMSAMEGISVRYLGREATEVPLSTWTWTSPR